MRGVTLNGIVRSYLGQQRKPIHYYARFLKYASDCLRELLFDTLKVVNTVRLPINEFYEAELPEDYVDYTKIGIQVGQFVRPLIMKETLNSLPNINQTTGAQEVYPNEAVGELNIWNWSGGILNANDENAGGYYGIGAGSEPDTYKVIEEQGIIRINQNITAEFVVLEYISDGSFSNSATKITPYAQKAIEAYINWQYKEHSRSFGIGEAAAAKQQFNRQHEILRARKDELTPELVKRIINRSRKASIK